MWRLFKLIFLTTIYFIIFLSYENATNATYENVIDATYENVINATYGNPKSESFAIKEGMCKSGSKVEPVAWLLAFKNVYTNNLQTPLCLAFSVLGLASNLLLMIVLTRKTLISPSNTFLIGMATADLSVLIVIIIRIIGMGYYPKGALLYASYKVYTYLAYLYFRSASNWITIALAASRYLTIHFPFQSIVKINIRNSIIAIIVCYVSVAIAFTPYYLVFYVIECPGANGTSTFRVSVSVKFL